MESRVIDKALLVLALLYCCFRLEQKPRLMHHPHQQQTTTTCTGMGEDEQQMAVKERERYGTDFKVSKCWSHVGDRADGKGGEQEEWITMGNNLADTQANKGRDERCLMEHGASALQLDFSLVDSNSLVDLAPRRAIRQAFELCQLEAGREDHTQGALLRILDALDAEAMRGCTEQSSERLVGKWYCHAFEIECLLFSFLFCV